MDIVGRTDRGLVRANNEDCIAVDLELGACVLADGMGGLNAGEHASAETVRQVLASLREHAQLDRGVIEAAVQRANERVYRLSREVPSLANMGTTVVVLAVTGDRALFGHVGDSRLYRLRAGELTSLTIDHSLVQQLIQEGVLDPSEAHTAPNRNIITRAIGIDPAVEVDVGETDLRAGDLLLVCSDGLSDMVDDDSIKNLLLEAADDLEATADTLVTAAKDRGGFDNISVLLLRIGS